MQKQEEWLGGRQKSLAPAANHYVCMQTHANTRQHTACHSRLPTGPACPQVETLGLGWCKVGNGPGVKAVADMLMYNQTIRRLDLRGNGLGNDGARAGRRGFCGLAWRVAGCCCCCPSRSYSPAGAIWVQPRLQGAHRLTLLFPLTPLSCLQARSGSAAASRSTPPDPSLPPRPLVLPAGAIWFSRGFKEHTNEQLRELELGYNEIKDEGACALAQVSWRR